MTFEIDLKLLISVNAMMDIKDIYKISNLDWQGDPCVPTLAWDGLNCSSGMNGTTRSLTGQSSGIDATVLRYSCRRSPCIATLISLFIMKDWTYRADGLMEKRQMSGNDVPITDQQRWFRDDNVDAAQIPENEFI